MNSFIDSFTNHYGTVIVRNAESIKLKGACDWRSTVYETKKT